MSARKALAYCWLVVLAALIIYGVATADCTRCILVGTAGVVGFLFALFATAYSLSTIFDEKGQPHGR